MFTIFQFTEFRGCVVFDTSMTDNCTASVPSAVTFDIVWDDPVRPQSGKCPARFQQMERTDGHAQEERAKKIQEKQRKAQLNKEVCDALPTSFRQNGQTLAACLIQSVVCVGLSTVASGCDFLNLHMARSQLFSGFQKKETYQICH